MPKTIKTQAEYKLVRQLIVDALTGDDNPLTRMVDKFCGNSPSSSDEKKFMYFILLSDLEEAAKEFADIAPAFEDEVIGERIGWRSIFEDSSYTGRDEFKGVFQDDKQ